uniref:Uncharacterized protein n=1 Tax=Panagrolaimus sp. PS1159 TaxID=55785 RepID=A0AC35FQI2_9BILA
MFIVLKLDSEHGKPPAAHLQKKAEFKVIRDRQHQRRDELATLFGVDLYSDPMFETELCQTAASPSASDMNQKENNNNLLTLDSVLD